jgi:ribosome-associated protein
MQRFQLQGEFIELNVLLKLLALAPSGGAAKAMIASGTVLVDGAVETRIRRKLRAGQTVRIGEQRIGIAAPNAVDDGKAVQ